jgi:mannose-6-phosphate isomerase-like protein (cupin superfamily)
MKLGSFLAVLGGLVLFAQSGNDVWIFSDQQVASTFSNIRKADPNKPTVSKVVGTFPGHSVMLIQRNGNGEVEVHARKHDIVFVREGSAVLVTGGKVVSGKDTGEGEVRGQSIEGGVNHTIRAGDIIQIPAKVPHQILLKQGETVAYVAVKVDAQ